MRDPVTLVVVAREAASLHTQLLATLHTALPRIGVLDPGIFACDLAGTEELLGAPSRGVRPTTADPRAACMGRRDRLARTACLRAAHRGRRDRACSRSGWPRRAATRPAPRPRRRRAAAHRPHRASADSRERRAPALTALGARGTGGSWTRHRLHARGTRSGAGARAPGRAVRARWSPPRGGDRHRAIPAREARCRRGASDAGQRFRGAASGARERMGGGDRMRLFSEPLPARLVWDEGELIALVVAGHRHTVVEELRKWRVEADWWKDGVARDYLTLRTADGLVCDVYGDRRSGAWWLQRVFD